MADDQMDDAGQADNAAPLATGMILITTIVLLVAIFTMWTMLKEQYGEGPLA